MHKFYPVFISTIIGSCLAFPQQPLQAIDYSSRRIVAIGDLHGDLGATKRAFKLAGAIDKKDNWVGKDLTIVQTGDQLDRGDDELAILKLLEKLTKQAPKFNSELYVLNGNHEYMNVQGDLRYITKAGFTSFFNYPGIKITSPQLAKIPVHARYRAAAFLPGGPFALKFAKRKTILQLGDNVFVHGGVLPHHVDYGIGKINQQYQAFLKGHLRQLPKILNNNSSPIWTRKYSDTRRSADCKTLSLTLRKMKAKRMMVAHTVHQQINSACNQQVWRIDVGMSKAYGGSVQVLEIKGRQVKVLKEKALLKP